MNATKKKRYTYTAPQVVNDYVEKLAHESGMSLSTLINVFLHQIYNTHTLKITLRDPDYKESDKYSPVPTKDTREAIKEAKDPKELKKLKAYHSVKDLMRDLNN